MDSRLPTRSRCLLAAAALTAWAGLGLCAFAEALVSYTINSSPEGIVATTSGELAQGQQLVSPLAPSSSGDYRFAYWRANASPVLSPAGPARTIAQVALNAPTTLTAVYLPSTQDLDSDTIPDWQEWRDFGSTSFSTPSNPDGDGFIVSIERTRGYPPMIVDTTSEGGVFRRASATVRYHNTTRQFYRYSVRSEPPGLIANSETVAVSGTTFISPNLNGDLQGYTFTHWTIDGVRQEGPDGSGRTRVIATIDRDNIQFVAHYTRTDADTDNDGIKDWIELRNFGNLDEDLSSNPDGDGFANETELTRAYSARVPDLLVEGGVGRGISKPVQYHDPRKLVYYELKSDPLGLIASQSGMAATGTSISTPNLTGELQGYMLSYWTVDGTRQATATGLARTQLSVSLDHDYMQIVAHFIKSSDDTDNDGIKDWIELRNFGTLDNDSSSDPDTDGFTIEAEQTRGYNSVVRDLTEEGGIFRTVSATVKYRNPDKYKFYLMGSDPSGLLLDMKTVLPDTELTTPNLYGAMQGYTFGFWSVNGSRQASSLGIARTKLKLTVNQDLTVLGHFFLTNADTDNDGIEDWREWFYLGTLASNELADPDSDGFNLAWELSHGLNFAVPDRVEEGGIFRTAAKPVTWIRPGDRFACVIRSEPPGLISRSEQILTSGTTIKTPLLHGSTQGFTFAYWTMNGVRQVGPSGRALDQVSVRVSETVELIAHYIADNADTDNDTLKDAYEWMEFGGLDQAPESDPDGDQMSIGMEIQRGYAPRIADLMLEGGVYRTASKVVTMQLKAYNIYHDLNVTIDPPGAGSVHGGGKVKHGVVATLSASVPPGVNGRFDHWSGDIDSTDNPVSLLMEAGHNVTAHFTVASYILQYAAGDHGSLSWNAGGNTGGSVRQDVAPGTSGTAVTAVPASGYHFVNWSDDSTQNPRVEEAVAGPVDVTANFALNVYPVTFDPGIHGSRSGGGALSQQIEHGADAREPQITPATHWRFLGWDIGFTQVTGTLNVTAQYQQITHPIAVSVAVAGGGNVSGGATYNEGETATVAATPLAGWRFVCWSENGTPVSTEASYSFLVAGARSLVAEFEPLSILITPVTKQATMKSGSYSISVASNTAWTVSENLDWVSLSASGSNGNGTITVTIAENNDALSRSGTLVFSGTLVTATHVITQYGGQIGLSQSHAGFTKAGGKGSVGVITSSYHMTWRAATTAGWIHLLSGTLGNGNGTVAYQVDAYDGVAPREGIIDIGGEIFTVQQAGTSPQGHLLVHVSGSGTISGATPEVTATKVVGKPVTITAKPALGQRFAGWTGSGLLFPPGGEELSKLTFVMGEEVELTAHFEADPYAMVKIAGEYVGIARGDSPSDPVTNGVCLVTLTPTGAFTSAITTGSGKYSGKGTLTSSGSGSVLLKLKNREPIYLAASLDTETRVVELQARLGGEIGPVLWSATAQKTFASSGTLAYSGTGSYTAFLLPLSGSSMGTGYSTLSVDAKGNVRYAGKLPDGTAINGSSKIDQTNHWALFVPSPYKTGGFALGALSVSAEEGAWRMEGAIHWLKRPITSPLVKDPYYRAGLEMDVFFEASKYSPPAAGQLLFQVPVPLGADNMLFSAVGDGLKTDPLNKTITLTEKNQFLIPAAAPSLKLGINLKTGLITATFLHDGTLKNVTGTGVIRQDLNRGEGVFPGQDCTGTILLRPANR